MAAGADPGRAARQRSARARPLRRAAGPRAPDRRLSSCAAARRADSANAGACFVNGLLLEGQRHRRAGQSRDSWRLAHCTVIPGRGALDRAAPAATSGSALADRPLASAPRSACRDPIRSDRRSATASSATTAVRPTSASMRRRRRSRRCTQQLLRRRNRALSLSASDCIFDGPRRGPAPPGGLRALLLRAARLGGAAALSLPARPRDRDAHRGAARKPRCAGGAERRRSEDAIRTEVAALIRPLFVSRRLRRPGLRPARAALRGADPHRRRERRRDGRVRIPEAAAARSEPARRARRVPALRPRSRGLLRHLTSMTAERAAMKGDLSRDTFDRALHYSAVRLQQGRIVTDADWNEQADLTRYRAERQARDTIGACGAPMDAAGYALVAETNALAVHAVNANVAWIAAEDGALLAHRRMAAPTGRWSTCRPRAHLRALAAGGRRRLGWSATAAWCATRPTRARPGSRRTPARCTTLRGVAVFDADHAWAVGDGGIVVATSDGGATWSLVQTGAARLLCGALQRRARPASRSARAARSSPPRDGGQTWTARGERHERAPARACGLRHDAAPGRPGRRHDPAQHRRRRDLAAVQHAVDGDALRDRAFATPTKAGPPARAACCCTAPTAAPTGRCEDVGTDCDPARRCRSSAASRAGWSATRRPRCASAAARPTLADLVLPAVNLSIEPGRCYVNGILCELEARASYAHQPDGGADERLAPGSYLIYLDAWQRHVSALEAPAIREVALGGPDTATRARTIAQVRALPLPASSPSDWNCASTIAAWDALVNAPRPRARGARRAAACGRQPVRDRRDRGLPAPGEPALPRRGARRRREPDLQMVARERLGRLCGRRASASTRRCSRPPCGWPRAAATPTSTSRRTIASSCVDDDAELHSARRAPSSSTSTTATTNSSWCSAGVPERRDRPGSVAPSDAAALGPQARRSPARTRCPSSKAPGSSSRTACRCASTPGGAYRPGDYWQIPARTITATSSGRATTTAIRSRARRPASPMPIAASASSRSAATARSPSSATAASSSRR